MTHSHADVNGRMQRAAEQSETAVKEVHQLRAQMGSVLQQVQQCERRPASPSTQRDAQAAQADQERARETAASSEELESLRQQADDLTERVQHCEAGLRGVQASGAEQQASMQVWSGNTPSRTCSICQQNGMLCDAST